MLKAAILCLVFLGVFILWVGWAGAGPFLACDLPDPGVTIAMSEVEITKVIDGSVSVVGGLVTVRGNDFLLMDLAGLAPAAYKFRGRWADATGWWSEYCPFYPAGKPKPEGGLRVVP
jgi:hypothetical protein